MPKNRLLLWWMIWLVIGVVANGLGYLVGAQGLTQAGGVIYRIGAFATYVWLVGGVFAVAQPRYVVWTLIHLAVGFNGALLAWTFFRVDANAAGLVVLGVVIMIRGAIVFSAFTTRSNRRSGALALLTCIDIAWFCYLCLQLSRSLGPGYVAAAFTIGGIFTMGLMFLGGLWLIRRLVSPPRPIFSVARTLIDEAVRMKIALVFIVLLLLIVPVLPYASHAQELLKYRIGTFLAWSLWSTALLLGFMTIFLSCGTICGEMRGRQIYLTITKPIHRVEYLLGKWLGIALLNLLLLSIAAAGVYGFARLMQAFGTSIDEYDRTAVTDEVLIARASMLPELPGGLDVDDLVEKQLKASAAQGIYLRDRAEGPGSEEAVQKEALNIVINRWHTVQRFDRQTYVYTGLTEAKEMVDTVQLKLKPAVSKDRPNDQQIEFLIRINDRPFALGRSLTLGVFQVVPIPTHYIDDHGRLEITIINENPKGQEHTIDSEISFTPDEGMQLLYRYGAFGPNLIRGMLILWIQLGFLAMVALATGTFLSFPVACLFAVLVYLTALVSGFLSESVSAYAVYVTEESTTWESIVEYPRSLLSNIEEGEIGTAIKVPIQIMGKFFLAVVPSFTKYNPAPLIADGQVILPKILLEAFLFIGILSTGTTGLIGWLIFRRREVARVTV